MAVQMGFAFSTYINGVAVYAGGPYYCAGGSFQEALTACGASPDLISISALIAYAKRFESDGTIDKLINIESQKVYIFSGIYDIVVEQGVCKALESMYLQLGAKVNTSYNLPAEHCWPTDDFGNACGYLGEPYLNNCDYNGALAALSTLYGSLNPGVSSIPANLFQVDQSEFTTKGDSLSKIGYIYVPTACQQGAKCKLHMSFHGCKMTIDDLGTVFLENNGLIPIAEANNIIVLFPQISRSVISPANPMGCWDWWGYTEPASTVYKTTYPTKNGVQMKTLWAMAQRISGGNKEAVDMSFESFDF